MITRKYPTILSAWRGVVEEAAFLKNHKFKFLRYGVCICYPDLLEIRVEDALKDENLHLDMSSFTKTRWTRFLRKYFRPDLRSWVSKSVKNLTEYSKRPFVASYDVNPNPESRMVGVGSHGGHKYGGCLSSLQIRVYPEPRVILYSRACMMDKIGFLDASLIHLVAKELSDQGYKKVKATWVVSLAFISAVNQTYYLKRFKLPLKGHVLGERVHAMSQYSESNFGPIKRIIKRAGQMKKNGTYPGGIPVKDLSLDFKLSGE